jgi:hypothetical protein
MHLVNEDGDFTQPVFDPGFNFSMPEEEGEDGGSQFEVTSYCFCIFNSKLSLSYLHRKLQRKCLISLKMVASRKKFSVRVLAKLWILKAMSLVSVDYAISISI